jgi:hypothetical protein
MAFNAKRAELIAEISELHRLQMGANHTATLGGWTRQSEAWYEMRDARIAALRRELEALEGTDVAIRVIARRHE